MDSAMSTQQHIAVMVEKRQLFLRSYQFCRKRTLADKIKGSIVKVRRLVWIKLRSARRLRRLVWSRFRCAFCYREKQRRRRFVRLFNHNASGSSSSCW